jgi:membrane-associated phospholipid phosphatase
MVARLAVLERDRRLLPMDEAASQAVAKPLAGYERAANALHPLGKWYAYVPAAAALGATIYAQGRGRPAERAAGAAAVLLASVISAGVNPLFDKVLPQPPQPPPARVSKPKPTFPSGHAFGLGSVAFAAAYVLLRERVIGPAAAVPLALLPPLVGGVAKLVERKHWPSEVVAGLLIALGIASSSAVVYELARGRPPRRRASKPRPRRRKSDTGGKRARFRFP